MAWLQCQEAASTQLHPREAFFARYQILIAERIIHSMDKIASPMHYKASVGHFSRSFTAVSRAVGVLEALTMVPPPLYMTLSTSSWGLCNASNTLEHIVIKSAIDEQVTDLCLQSLAHQWKRTVDFHTLMSCHIVHCTRAFVSVQDNGRVLMWPYEK